MRKRRVPHRSAVALALAAGLALAGCGSEPINVASNAGASAADAGADTGSDEAADALGSMRLCDDGEVLDVDLVEIQDLRNEIAAVLDETELPFGVGLLAEQGMAAVSVPILNEDYLAPLRQFADRPFCVVGLDPALARIGPQIEGGEGWRLLAIDSGARRDAPPPTPGGDMIERRLEIATSPAQLDTMWQTTATAFGSGLLPDAPMPNVNFDDEIVVLGIDSEAVGCPVLVWGMIHEVEAQKLVADVALSDDAVLCPSEHRRTTWVLALERAALPAPPFELIGSRGNPPPWIEADLREPGATIDVAALGLRPGRVAPTPMPTPVAFSTASLDAPEATVLAQQSDLAFPHVIEPGVVGSLDLPLLCMSAIGPINDAVWVPVNQTFAYGDSPDDWRAVAADGVAVVDLLLSEGPEGEPTLDVTAGGYTERFVPADRPPACP